MVMEYGHVDTSGTDDDLSLSHNNRVPRGGRFTGNGRTIVGSVPLPMMHSDMESEIHQLEQEAYSSVLRAFKAQSDALTWEKEGLITELRKELRVSDDEHRELLGRVNADDIIRRIREWRLAGGHHGPPSPTASSRKKHKTTQSVPQSFGVPLQSSQPSPSTVKRATSFGSGGRWPKPGHPGIPGLSSMNSMQYPSAVPMTWGQLVANDPAETAKKDPLIGRKVMTRWPEDNNFYEAVITEYNLAEGRHALVYDIHTAKETWEWVDLKEISPDDIRWVGEDPGICHRGGRGVVPGDGRGIGSMNDQFKKKLPQLQNGVGKVSDDIEILDTETLIKEVEKVFCASHPDLLEIDKAKKMLMEHEQALMDVIEKLADASDSESDAEQQIPNGQPINGEWRNMHSGGYPLSSV